MNKLFTLITIALIILIALAFWNAVDVFAAPLPCDTVDGNAVMAYDGHNMDSMDANTRHCTADSVNVDQPVTHKQDKYVTVTHVTIKVIVDSTVPTVNPTTPSDNPTVPSDTPNKKHCNNGEGNGAEGCSPAKSQHANNDENNTTPKEDKSNK